MFYDWNCEHFIWMTSEYTITNILPPMRVFTYSLPKKTSHRWGAIEFVAKLINNYFIDEIINIILYDLLGRVTLLQCKPNCGYKPTTYICSPYNDTNKIYNHINTNYINNKLVIRIKFSKNFYSMIWDKSSTVNFFILT